LSILIGIAYYYFMDEISANDAAAILGVTSAQIRWYYRRGHLAGRRIGAQMLVFRRADVEAFVKPKKTGRPKTPTARATAGPKKRRGKSKKTS
jgi:Helix-turn-helix domain